MTPQSLSISQNETGNTYEEEDFTGMSCLFNSISDDDQEENDEKDGDRVNTQLQVIHETYHRFHRKCSPVITSKTNLSNDKNDDRSDYRKKSTVYDNNQKKQEHQAKTKENIRPKIKLFTQQKFDPET